MKVVGYAPEFYVAHIEMGQQRSIQKLFMFDKNQRSQLKQIDKITSQQFPNVSLLLVFENCCFY